MRKLQTLLWMIWRRDPLLSFFLLQKIGAWLVPKYRFNWPQLAWWDDNEFNAYLKRFDELDSNNADRHWMLAQLMRLVSEVPGDTAECGVFKGASSYLICQGNQKAKVRRIHHMFDSFSGLSEPSLRDGDFWSGGDLACSLDEVRANLAEFGEDAVRFYEGWIPDRFSEVSDRRFSFVHIDVDLFEPTRDSLAFFYPRMHVGGIILCDDYGFTTCPGATAACDEYLQDRPESMIGLSCGGGFLIKKGPQPQ
ncbi:MAG TPA: macrocin O-methyltransferase [Sedimenticola sp.]|nr:macrocin O-methyltransferase [Sedimenticola sp.]